MCSVSTAQADCDCWEILLIEITLNSSRRNVFKVFVKHIQLHADTRAHTQMLRDPNTTIHFRLYEYCLNISSKRPNARERTPRQRWEIASVTFVSVTQEKISFSKNISPNFEHDAMRCIGIELRITLCGVLCRVGQCQCI